MNSQELNKFIKENVDKIYDEMVKIRRTIHMNPELGDEEFETSKLIKEFLTKNNIEFLDSYLLLFFFFFFLFLFINISFGILRCMLNYI